MITVATINDIPALNKLINGAYRGESSKLGWTTEADLLDGIRIDENELTKLVNENDSRIFVYKVHQQLQGCVLLQKQDKTMYLGMLTVDPVLQGKGVGKQLLQFAEWEAKRSGCSKIQMTVISVRTELIQWYMRNGYHDSGITKAFPSDEKFGKPRMPLEFIVMEKNIE